MRFVSWSLESFSPATVGYPILSQSEPASEEMEVNVEHT